MQRHRHGLPAAAAAAAHRSGTAPGFGETAEAWSCGRIKGGGLKDCFFKEILRKIGWDMVAFFLATDTMCDFSWCFWTMEFGFWPTWMNMGKLSMARCGRHHPDFSNHRFCPAPEHGFLPAESWMPLSNMGISRRMLEIQGNNSHCHDPTEGTCLWVPIAAVFHNPCIPASHFGHPEEGAEIRPLRHFRTTAGGGLGDGVGCPLRRWGKGRLRNLTS